MASAKIQCFDKLRAKKMARANFGQPAPKLNFSFTFAPEPVLELSKVSGGGGTHGASVETESDYCLPLTPKTDFLVCRKTERGVILKGKKGLSQ